MIKKTLQDAGLMAKAKEADNTGTKTMWPLSILWAASTPSAEPATNQKPLTNPEPDADKQLQDLVVENPGMNAATLVNAMRANGLGVVDQKAKLESDSSGAFPQNTRGMSNKQIKKKRGKDNAKEERTSESAMKDSFTAVRFLEADAGVSNGKKPFKVALIQEGLGNFRDCFYYTRQALESAVTAFEGKKCYMDHPSRTDEIDRPERTARDIIGHFENCNVAENKDGSAMLCADLLLVESASNDQAKSLILHALDYSKKYPDKEFVGLSINAAGDANPVDIETFIKSTDIPASAKPKLLQAIENGVTQVRIVTAIQDAVSTDLVTEPGAKGKFLESFNESQKEKTMAKDILPKEAEEKKEAFGKKEDESESKKESMGNQDASADQTTDDHADADQDKELILQMIKKYMAGQQDPDGQPAPEHSAEDEAALKAYEGYKEMGYEHEAAMQNTAHTMKLANHLSGKAPGATQESAKKEDESESHKEAKEDESESHKESSSKIKLEARVAFLESQLNKEKFDKILDKKLMESKLPRSATDKIRAKSFKTEKALDEAIKIYADAFKEAGFNGSESKKPSNIFVTSAEKTSGYSMSESKKGFSFNDCKIK